MSETIGATPPRRTGAIASADDSVVWRVWAPNAREVTLVLIDGEARRAIPMNSESRGYHSAAVRDIRDGQKYAYRLDGGPERPDPCSLWQPDDVDGASAVVRPGRFAWTDHDWRGIRRADLVFYEIHVGTFTPEGTFAAIIPRIDDLRDLGITAIEIMPVGQFPGARNWGYDGVLPYAAQNTYGGPHGLQKLIDACHARGMAIYLDVVYNHFGPEANYLAEFGPYFTDRYKTPWGTAVNYDRAGCDAVRDFVLDNVRMWLEEFHIDGLRLDAADTIFDMGARHILRAITEAAAIAGERRGWPAVLTAESDLDDPRLLYSPERGGYGLDAQWMDDYHHAAHAFLTGERHGYYTDFGEASQLAQVLEQPYLYQWNYSPFRDRKHGARPEGLGGDRFIVFLQNHDQIGNRASGDRLNTLMASPAKRRLGACYLLLSPYLPLLFMGEEYGEEAPFPYFCSFRGAELVKAIREGRRREYSAHDRESVVPDPVALATFESARLSWSWPPNSERAGLRRLHRDLLMARREWPALGDCVHRTARLIADPDGSLVLEFVRGAAEPDRIRALFNLGDRAHPLADDVGEGKSTLFSSEAVAYSGGREAVGRIRELLPYECVVWGPAECRAFP